MNSSKASPISLAHAFGIVVTIALFSLLLSALLISTVNDMYAFIKKDSVITISVKEGSSLSEFSKLLSDNGIIKNPNIFKLYVISKQKTNAVKSFSGELTVNSNFSYRQILSALQSNKD